MKIRWSLLFVDGFSRRGTVMTEARTEGFCNRNAKILDVLTG